MTTTTACLRDTHADATAQVINVDILDVPMPAFFGKGLNNTLRDQTPETQKSVLAMLEFHSY
jgi:hypothetical protein